MKVPQQFSQQRTHRLEEALIVALVERAQQGLRVGQLARDRDDVRVVDDLRGQMQPLCVFGEMCARIIREVLPSFAACFCPAR